MQYLSLALAVLAVVVSVVTLWRTHLAPFRPICLFDDLSMGAVWRSSGSDSWISPHWKVDLTVVNPGGKIGKILGARIILHHTLHSARAIEILSLARRYDPAKHEDIEDDSVRTPFVILPKQTVTKTLRFTKRWEFEIRLDDAIFELQILIDAKKGWTTVEEWSCPGGVPWQIFRDGSLITLFRESLMRTDFAYSREVHESLRIKK